MQEKQNKLLRAAVLCMVALSTANAFAQEPDEEKKKDDPLRRKLPLQKGPMVNPRGLQIPGKLPQIQKGTPPATVGPKGLEGVKKGAPPQEGEQPVRSEEHTSELQSQSKLVCRLLLEKKKFINYNPSHFVLQQIDYLQFIDLYDERIKMLHVKDAEFNPDGTNVVYG